MPHFDRALLDACEAAGDRAVLRAILGPPRGRCPTPAERFHPADPAPATADRAVSLPRADRAIDAPTAA